MTLSQLAAQLARPVQTSSSSSLLPSYSQAIASQIVGPGLQTSPRGTKQQQPSPGPQATPSLQVRKYVNFWDGLLQGKKFRAKGDNYIKKGLNA